MKLAGARAVVTGAGRAPERLPGALARAEAM
jgi:hypothetical protein